MEGNNVAKAIEEYCSTSWCRDDSGMRETSQRAGKFSRRSQPWARSREKYVVISPIAVPTGGTSVAQELRGVARDSA